MSSDNYEQRKDPLKNCTDAKEARDDDQRAAVRMALTQHRLYFKDNPSNYFKAANATLGNPLPHQDILTLRREHRRNYKISKLVPDDLRIETAYSSCVSISKLPLSVLERTAISNLRLSITSTKGCYLLLRTLELPIFLIGLKTVVEDHTGDVVTFSVFSFFSLNSGTKPEDILPVGTVFILKEPLLKLTEGGDYAIHCDCPSDMIVLPKYHPSHFLSEQVAWKNTIDEALKEEAPVSASDWKTLGNIYYKKSMLPKALEAYLVALKLIPNEDKAMKCILMSNVSVTYLKMEHFESVLLYSKYVLEVDPRNLKAMFRRARAQYELQEYKEAYHSFKSALEIDPSNQDVVKELERCSLRLEEQRGRFNIYKLFLTSTLKPKTRIDCASYTGPVRIVPVPGKGRGLVATETIKPGTLLCVSKAVHASFGDNGSHIEAAKLVGRTIQTVLKNPVVLGAKIYDLSSGGKSEHSELLCDDEERIVDVERIRKIVSTNYYSIEKADLSRPANMGIGLFLTASYINHSCVFNANWVTYNDVMVIFAVKPINREEEVTISYCAHAEEYITRKDYFSERGFQCNCSLCESERENSADVLKLRYDLSQQFQDLKPRIGITSMEQSVKVIEEMKELVKRIEVTYNHTSREVLKCTLLIPYMRLALAMTELGDLQGVLKFAEKALNSVGLNMRSLLEFSESGKSFNEHSLVSFEWFNIAVYAICAFTMSGRKLEAKKWFKVLVDLEGMYTGGNEEMAKKKYLREISNHMGENQDICCTH